MLRKAFHIVLIAITLACPVMCGKGMCECAAGCESSVDSDQYKDDCCEAGCCSKSYSNDNSSKQPVQPENYPCKKKQCLCAGATLEKSSQLTPTSTTVYPFDLWVVSNTLNLSLLSSVSLVELSPDEGVIKSGRSVCAMRMSFLC